MGKPSSPSSPDYIGAANATAASQRVNYQSPWGSVNWYAPGSTIPSSYYGSPQQGSPNQTIQPPPGAGRMHALDTGSPGPSGPGDPGSASTDGNNTAGNAGAGWFTGSSENAGSLAPTNDPSNPVPGAGGSSGSSVDTRPWTQVVSLSPTQQQLLDYQNQTSLGLGALQSQGLMNVQNLFNNLPSQSQLPAAAMNPGETAQDAILRRTMPILNQQHDRLDNQLANQGIQLGTEAYGQAQDQFGRQVNDAVSQAALQGIDVGQRARQQAMGEQGFYSQLPLNLLNALRSGSQVQLPSGAGTGPTANYLGAAQAQGQGALNQYNAQMGSYNSGMQALGSLLAAYFSDRRLKSNITRVGTHPMGIGVYEYDIFGKRERGVMADEVERVMPEAVVTDASGFKKVRYGMIGGV